MMLKILNIISINGQGSATSVTSVDSLPIYIYIYIDTCVDGHLCLAKIDCSLFSWPIPLLLLLGTPEPTKYIW